MQKLRTCFLATIFTAACIGSALAQEPAEPNEPPAPRREIGFGTNIILASIFQSGSAPLDLMYRWGNDHSLYRLGTSLYYTNRISHWNNLDSNQQQNSFSTTLFLGREWRVQVAKRWLVNFGSDINFNFSGSANELENKHEESQGQIRRIINETQERRLGGGIRPFVGVLFKINNRLLLGTEASFMAIVNKYNSSAAYFSLINDVFDEEYTNYDRGSSGWEYNIYTQPASNIFVYYRF
jgi:hypothetical protein